MALTLPGMNQFSKDITKLLCINHSCECNTLFGANTPFGEEVLSSLGIKARKMKERNELTPHINSDENSGMS